MNISDLTYVVTADGNVRGGFMEVFVGTTPEGGFYSSSTSAQEAEGGTATSSYSASGTDFAMADAAQFSSPMAIEMMS
jgi:hypothetical protein